MGHIFRAETFFCQAAISAIVQYRPQTGTVVRTIRGPFSYQHDVDIESEHSILLYNNNLHGGYTNTSEVVRYDFRSREFTKLYDDELRKLDFKSDTNGLLDLSSEKSIMLEETIYGRIVLLDRNGETVWQFVNKADDGLVYRMNWSRVISDRSKIKSIRKSLSKMNCLN